MKKKINWKYHITNYAVLIVGLLACCFTRFTFNMWFCAFIFPGCFLFFERREKSYISLPVIFACAVIGGAISLWKFADEFSKGIQAALAFLVGALYTLPYILDKLVYVRFFSKRQLVLSFLFPLTWIVFDVIIGFTPLGNVLAIGNALNQIITVTSIVSFLGINFLSFVIIYFGSGIAQFAINWKANIKTLIIVGSLIGGSLVYSGIYNLVPISSSKTVNIMTGYSTNDTTGYDRTKLSLEQNIEWLNIDATQASLYSTTNKIDLLVYPEETFWLYENEVEPFKQAIQKAADDNDLYIITGIEVHKEKDATKDLRNLAWIVQPHKEIIEYVKTYLVPIEEDGYIKGTGDIKYVDIPNKGRVGVAICMDAEFPRYIAKAGRMNCDALITPAWDWDTMFPCHSPQVCFRAVENGFNFLRCTEDGYSIASDYKGNVITKYYTSPTDECKATHSNHIFALPIKGRVTPYRYLSIVVDYAYPIALASLITTFAVLDYSKKSKKQIKK